MKNILEQISGNQVLEKKLEYVAIETIQNETKKRNNLKEKSTHGQQGTFN